MPARTMATSQFSSAAAPSPWVLLDEVASIGRRRNATTARALTSAGATVEVSFDLVDPPGISRCFVHFSGLKEREPKRKAAHILNAAGESLLLMRTAVFTGALPAVNYNYFVYNAGGPGRNPSLDIIPGPYPKIFDPKQISILPLPCRRGGVGGRRPRPPKQHYAVVFPAPRFEARAGYEMHVFSSETRAWRTKVAPVAVDRETGRHDVVRHWSSKVLSAGGGRLAWVDLWHGVLLCDMLDEHPTLRMLQWPVAPPDHVSTDMYSARSIRDATLSTGGQVRFVELSFDDNNGDGEWGWTATVWRRDVGSAYWYECFKADIAGILAKDSRFSDLVRKVWDDEVNKRGLDNVFSSPPTLSLSNEDVIYLMTKLKSEVSEALLLSVNGKEARPEEVQVIPYNLTYRPCSFSIGKGV